MGTNHQLGRRLASGRRLVEGSGCVRRLLGSGRGQSFRGLLQRHLLGSQSRTSYWRRKESHWLCGRRFGGIPGWLLLPEDSSLRRAEMWKDRTACWRAATSWERVRVRAAEATPRQRRKCMAGELWVWRREVRRMDVRWWFVRFGTFAVFSWRGSFGSPPPPARRSATPTYTHSEGVIQSSRLH